MELNDAQLIQQILQGDQDAFSPLIKKYQKGVHALVWRKIGDFHTAQEITQDTFLRAYQKLGTLKNHNQFPGWLYVIAANLSRDWLRRSRLPMESLDADDTNEVDKVSYSRYVVEKQEADADETRREVVKELLQKLPESERTVMTLHYLGEMTIKAISEFLGVSQNTVKSRLSRARNRLKKQEDVLQHNLGSFQLPDNMAENIMREVSRMPPIPTSVSKPVAPLALSAASAVLIFLLMGVGTQYLSRFQKPYSLDAVSEPTVEIIDTVFVLDSPAKPAIRTQAGRSDTPGKGPGAGQTPDESLFTTVPIDTEDVLTPRQQWVQTEGPQGADVQNMFITSNGDFFARSGEEFYRLTDDGQRWNLINSNTSFKGPWRMAEKDDVLYIVSDTQILTSTDKGKAWETLGTRPEGELIDILITDEAFYLGLADGIFRSVDTGKLWTSLKDGDLADRKIRAITAIGNTLFVGTDSGLYRLNSGGWKQLPVGEDENIRALASDDHRLYVVVGEADKRQSIKISFSMQAIQTTSPSFYRSTDLGDSWQALDFITDTDSESGIRLKINAPTNNSEETVNIDTEIVASGENLIVLYSGKGYYSNDSGETWDTLEANTSDIGDVFTLVSLNNKTFYRGGQFGVHRTTDAGKTWHQFSTGLVKTGVLNMVATHDVLYANMGRKLVTSSDSGETWTTVPGNFESLIGIMKFNNTVYVRGIKEMSVQLLHLSSENGRLTPVPGMPALQGTNYLDLVSKKIETDLLGAVGDEDKNDLEENIELNPEDIPVDTLIEDYSDIVEKSVTQLLLGFFGSFAVSDSTYYMEYEQRLFKWEPGMAEWSDTGLIDEGETTYSYEGHDDLSFSHFQLAVLGKVVYVGKRDGHLFQSFDEGETWNDVTTDLPFSVTSFNAIVFAGSTVYVATDKGVAYSDDGTHWQATTDMEGTPIVIDKLAVDGTTVYGICNQRVYQVKENADIWQQVTPEIPVPVNSLAVDGSVLYVGTLGSGVLRFTLDESH